ncbi:MAG: UDP-3-O-(3-hydroxymyristoyl)glucosamine N-acyltransferase, partial [Gemmatimonadetes bacterium]|nr:UDP-3-O-(3-hydroxymyristoyl)glucosamine N-acyltransferase [Gemmatimonadota bacterium]
AQRRYLREMAGTQAGALLVSEELAQAVENHPCRIVVKDAHGALPVLLSHFYPEAPREPGIHPTAVFGKGVALGKGVSIGPYAVLEEGVVLGDRASVGSHSVLGAGSRVGEDSAIHPHVVLYPKTQLGARVIIHAGARVGADGFGYVPDGEGIAKVPQVGGCVLEDDVEVGANTCIDRGSIGDTRVGRFSKLDNLVQLAHNVQVGRCVLMAAFTGVSGSTEIGNGVMTAGQTGFSGHLKIGDGVRVAAKSAVLRDVPAGMTVSGSPAREHRETLRAQGLMFRLPETTQKIKELEKRLAALEGSEEG